MCLYKECRLLRTGLGDLHASRELGAAKGHAVCRADTLSFSSLWLPRVSLKGELEGVPCPVRQEKPGQQAHLQWPRAAMRINYHERTRRQRRVGKPSALGKEPCSGEGPRAPWCSQPLQQCCALSSERHCKPGRAGTA